MGCSTSTDVRSSRPGDAPDDSAKKRKDLDKLIKHKMAIEKNSLRIKSLPVLETRTSCESMDDFLVQEASIKENNAATLIQKQARRKKALEEAKKQQKWVIFNSLDLMEEHEMVILTKFMQVAMNKVPGLGETNVLQQSKQALETLKPDEQQHEDVISLTRKYSSKTTIITRNKSSETLIHVDRTSSKGSFTNLSRENSSIQLTMSNIAVGQTSNKSLSNYYIAKGPVTIATVQEIINVYEKRGKLSVDSVHKILKLAYRLLKKQPNTTPVIIGPSDRLNVVGDIHGQLADLLHILSESGLPSTSNKYIFNGDFVDRGPYGVEVMCVLLAMYIAIPDSIALNRGNHEDYAICTTYGFQAECERKYDDTTFGMFCELFNYLPLFTLINNSILVLHGGLFHAQDTSLQELNQINRTEFTLTDTSLDDSLDPVPRYKRDLFLKQLARDALWSDPMEPEGYASNPRGAGVSFGPDITRSFLTLNNLKMIVRSHECIRTGFDLPYQGDDKSLLCTIFSASNYCGGGNSAAYMVFTTSPNKELSRNGNSNQSIHVEGTDIHYFVYYFSIESNYDTVQSHNLDLAGSTLYDHILQKKKELFEEFKAYDHDNSELVTTAVWAEVMEKIMRLHVRWLLMIDELVLPECYIDGKINYTAFISSFTAQLPSRKVSDGDDESVQLEDFTEASSDLTSNELIDSNSESNSILTGGVADALYAQHHKLAAVFHFFDKNGDGVISTDEFISGCELLNQTLDDHSKIVKIPELLRILDVEQSGNIQVNEFFEMFRLSSTEPQQRRKSIIRSESLKNLSAAASFGDSNSTKVDISGIVIDIDASTVRKTNDVADDRIDI